MKVFRRIEDYDLRESEEPVVVAIGNFDGVHPGHQEVIRKLLEIGQKKKLKSCVLTFEPHPKKILFNPEFRVLQDIEEKCSELSRLRVKILIVHPFDRGFASLAPEEFITGVLRQRLNASHVVVGNDFSCGAGGRGSIDEVGEILKKDNIELTVVPPFVREGEEVHSNMIRELIKNGRIEEANGCLFTNYSLSGKVIHGKCRGAELGFPTINFFNEVKVIPAKGVYFTKVVFNGEEHDSVTNIGNSPTFGPERLRIETHILDFKGDLYGKYVQLNFYKRLRNEEKFSSKDALKEQIKKDIRMRRHYRSLEIKN